MAASLGTLTLGLSLGDAVFKKSANNVIKSFNKMIRGLRSRSKAANVAIGGIVSSFRGLKKAIGLAGSALKLGGGLFGAGVAGATAFASAVVKATGSLDAIGKLATQTGIAAEQLQVYQRAAELGGVATETLNSGLQAFTRRIGDAQQGFGLAKTTLEKYNVAIRDSNGAHLSGDQVLRNVVERLRTMTSETERASLASAVFSRQGLGLGVALGKLGSGGIDKLKSAMLELGLIIDGKTIKAAERAQDQFSLMGLVIKQKTLATLGKFAPELGNIAQAISTTFAKNFNLDISDEGIRDAVDRIIEKFFDFAEQIIRAFDKAKEVINTFLKGLHAIAVGIDGLPGFDIPGIGENEHQLNDLRTELIKVENQLKINEGLAANGSERAAGFVEKHKAKIKELKQEMAALSKSKGSGPFQFATGSVDDQVGSLRNSQKQFGTEFTNARDNKPGAANIVTGGGGGGGTGKDVVGGVDGFVMPAGLDEFFTKLNNAGNSDNVVAINTIVDDFQKLGERATALELSLNPALAKQLQYQKNLDLIRQAQEAGLTPMIPYAEQVKQLTDQFNQSLAEVPDKAAAGANFQQFGQNVAQSLEQAAASNDYSGLKNVLKQQLMSFITQAIDGIGSGGGSGIGGVLGGLFGGGGDKALPGAATGASFMVGGKGGQDNNVVAFKATKGEKVDVSTPGQQAANGGALSQSNTINNSFAGATIHASNEEELKQVAQAAQDGAVGKVMQLAKQGRLPRG